MLAIDEIEKTNKSRFRKLLLSFGAAGGMLYVQFASGQPITWPCAIGVALVVLAFTSSDTLEKIVPGALTELKGKIPGLK